MHPGGLRHIRSDRRINEWRAPGRKTIVRAATNERQVVVAMSGGEIIYFELAAAGQLLETEKKELGGDIASLDIASIPAGRQRTRFLAVGAFDSTVSASSGKEETLPLAHLSRCGRTPGLSETILSSLTMDLSGSQ